MIDENTKKYLCPYAESVLLRFTNETTTKTTATKRLENHLVSIEFTSIHFLFSLLLERNNNKSYEHIKKEERKYDDEADVVKRHLNLIVFYRSLILFCCVDCVIHSSADKYGEYWMHGVYLVNLITKFKGGLSMQLRNSLHLSVGDTLLLETGAPIFVITRTPRRSILWLGKGSTFISQLFYKTLSIGPFPGNELNTSCSAAKRITDC